MVGRITDVLETQNIEDAENNLNREITRLKMANESLLSQRTIIHVNQSSQNEEYLQSRLLSNKDNITKENVGDITKPGLSGTHNDISMRQGGAGYKDNSVSVANDLVVSVSTRQAMTAIDSRNDHGIGLKSSPTKERMNENVSSIPSGNQFTLTESRIVKAKFGTNEKPVKMSTELFGDYKNQNEIIEEERNPNDNSENMILGEYFPTNNPDNGLSNCDDEDEEEEKKPYTSSKANPYATTKSNKYVSEVSVKTRPELLTKVENLQKVVVKSNIKDSKNNSAREETKM
jgi:hypothetical protein